MEMYKDGYNCKESCMSCISSKEFCMSCISEQIKQHINDIYGVDGIKHMEDRKLILEKIKEKSKNE